MARRSRTSGFTLVEMVIAMTVIGILAYALLPLAVASVQAYQTSQNKLVAADRLRYAVARMAREMREVSYASDTGFALGNMPATSPATRLTLSRQYIDSAGTSSGPVTVTLALSSGSLTLQDSRYTTLGAQTLCDNVASLQFNFLDERGQVLASATGVTVYAIQVVLQLNAASGGLREATTVELKNRVRAAL